MLRGLITSGYAVHELEKLRDDEVFAKAAQAEEAAEAIAGQNIKIFSFKDLSILKKMELGGPRTEGQPGDLNDLGPLWPDGEPEWCRKAMEGEPIAESQEPTEEKAVVIPADPQGPLSVTVGPDVPEEEEAGPPPTERLRLWVEVNEFAPEDEVAEELIGLINALNAYHIANGGNGLVIDDWQLFVQQHEPAEVM